MYKKAVKLIIKYSIFKSLIRLPKWWKRDYGDTNNAYNLIGFLVIFITFKGIRSVSGDFLCIKYA